MPDPISRCRKLVFKDFNILAVRKPFLHACYTKKLQIHSLIAQRKWKIKEKRGRKEDSKQQMSSARLERGHIGLVGVPKPYAHPSIESALHPIIYAGWWRVQPWSAAHPFSTYSGLAIFTSVWPTWDPRHQNVVTCRSCGSQLNSRAGGKKKNSS